MWFRKKKDQHWEQLSKIVELMKLSMAEMAKEIDIIKEKFKHPLIKKNIEKADTGDIKEEITPIDDGFDELRRLRKVL